MTETVLISHLKCLLFAELKPFLLYLVKSKGFEPVQLRGVVTTPCRKVQPVQNWSANACFWLCHTLWIVILEHTVLRGRTHNGNED